LDSISIEISPASFDVITWSTFHQTMAYAVSSHNNLYSLWAEALML